MTKKKYYTIAQLAKVNECENLDAYGLAQVWCYWYVCNCGGRKTIIEDFKSLHKADRQQMLCFLHCEPFYSELYNHIINNVI